MTRDPRWGYGLCGGGGFSVLFGRFEAAFEARYYLGYSDVLRNGTKYTGNPNHSPLDNINLSLAVYYRLGAREAYARRRARASPGVCRRPPSGGLEKRLERETDPQATDTLPAAVSVPADSVSLAPLPPVGAADSGAEKSR